MMAEKNKFNSDLYHLELLSIFHYVVGGAMYLFGGILFFYFVRGLIIIFTSVKSSSGEDSLGVLFCLIYVIFFIVIVLYWTLATLIVKTGRGLAQLKSYKFCVIIAAIECIFVTLLGVLTVIVLLRPSVKELFNGTSVTLPENPI
jgi:hypothetical protein